MISFEDLPEFMRRFKEEFPPNYADLTREQKDRLLGMAVPYPEDWK
jgi:hypothetical protein